MSLTTSNADKLIFTAILSTMFPPAIAVSVARLKPFQLEARWCKAPCPVGKTRIQYATA